MYKIMYFPFFCLTSSTRHSSKINRDNDTNFCKIFSTITFPGTRKSDKFLLNRFKMALNKKNVYSKKPENR